MIKPAQLNLDILSAENRREFAKELQGSVIIISDTEIKAYSDGREVDLGVDAYGPALRYGNGNGIYAVGEATTEASAGQGQAPEGMADTIKSIWERRRMAGHISAIANTSLAPRDIYAARRGQVSA